MNRKFFLFVYSNRSFLSLSITKPIPFLGNYLVRGVGVFLI
jgi:hypothetical protein